MYAKTMNKNRRITGSFTVINNSKGEKTEITNKEIKIDAFYDLIDELENMGYEVENVKVEE